MNGFRISAAFAAALAACALTASAQGVTSADPKKTPKAEAAKDQKQLDAAPKADAKKADGKAPAKKAAPKKAPAKAPPKKVDGKVQSTAAGGTIQKYEAGKAPDLKDAKGNTVSTSPDAYDISSATAPAKTPAKKK
jgi:hypothetical protein